MKEHKDATLHRPKKLSDLEISAIILEAHQNPDSKAGLEQLKKLRELILNPGFERVED